MQAAQWFCKGLGGDVGLQVSKGVHGGLRDALASLYGCLLSVSSPRLLIHNSIPQIMEEGRGLRNIDHRGRGWCC